VWVCVCMRARNCSTAQCSNRVSKPQVTFFIHYPALMGTLRFARVAHHNPDSAEQTLCALLLAARLQRCHAWQQRLLEAEPLGRAILGLTWKGGCNIGNLVHRNWVCSPTATGSLPLISQKSETRCAPAAGRHASCVGAPGFCKSTGVNPRRLNWKPGNALENPSPVNQLLNKANLPFWLPRISPSQRPSQQTQSLFARILAGQLEVANLVL
jgi:hypothetical protein